MGSAILRGHGERERSFNTHSLTLGGQFESIGGILHALRCIPRSRFAQGGILPPDRRIFLAVGSDGGFCRTLRQLSRCRQLPSISLSVGRERKSIVLRIRVRGEPLLLFCHT